MTISNFRSNNFFFRPNMLPTSTANNTPSSTNAPQSQSSAAPAQATDNTTNTQTRTELPNSLRRLLLKYREQGCSLSEIKTVLENLNINYNVTDNKVYFEYAGNHYYLTFYDKADENSAPRRAATAPSPNATQDNGASGRRSSEINTRLEEISARKAEIKSNIENLDNEINSYMSELSELRGESGKLSVGNFFIMSEREEILREVEFLDLKKTMLNNELANLEKEENALNNEKKKLAFEQGNPSNNTDNNRSAMEESMLSSLDAYIKKLENQS